MKAYILSVAGIVLVTAAISIISPGGKMGAFVKGMGKLFILVVMIAPFASLLSGGKQSVFVMEELQTNDAYLASCAKILSERDESEIASYLSENFSIVAEVSVERGVSEGFPRERILVKITDFGIIGQDGHIDKTEQVRRALKERYGCEAVVS